MKFKLEIEAENYDEFIRKTNEFLNKISRERGFKRLLEFPVFIKSFSLDGSEFTITEGHNEEELRELQTNGMGRR